MALAWLVGGGEKILSPRAFDIVWASAPVAPAVPTALSLSVFLSHVYVLRISALSDQRVLPDGASQYGGFSPEKFNVTPDCFSNRPVGTLVILHSHCVTVMLSLFHFVSLFNTHICT